MRVLLFLSVQAIGISYGQLQPSDGNNLETFPSIINPSTSSNSASTTSVSRVFSSATLGHGPAISPTSYVSSPPATAAPTSSSQNQTTLISASLSNYTASQPSVSLVTSTVSGSATTVTVTNSAAGASQSAGTSDATRLLSSSKSFGIAMGFAVVLLSTVGASQMVSMI
ncbi:hypothetical protein JCM3765_000517 [Sporobolomyces pararoseus]